MKKRVLAMVLALAMFVGMVPFAASAVPYTPSANAWKDYGQEHLYFYEVAKGKAAPKMDGKITEADGYGEPIATYAFRYCAPAENVTPEINNGEFQLRSDGSYYVFPTKDSPQEVWDAITSFENDSPYGYIWNYRHTEGTFYSSATYYYQDPDTLQFVRAYHATKDNFQNYDAKNSAGGYVLKNKTLLTKKPADWETNFASYYTNDNFSVKATADEKAPAFKSDTYYKGDRINVKYLYMNSEGAAASIAYMGALLRGHVILPEKVNVYARYNGSYFYYAIEVTELEHTTTGYGKTCYFSTTMSNSSSMFSNSYDYSFSISKEAGKGMTMTTPLIRTHLWGNTALKDNKYIIRKYGKLDANTVSDVTTPGVDYNITHTPYQAPVVENTDEFGFDMGGGYDMGGAISDEELTSGTYGTTVYESRTPWKVLNGKYNPAKDSTAVPEVFSMRAEIPLENTVSTDAFRLCFAMPRSTAYYPGSTARTGGTYPAELYNVRYPQNTGLTEGDDFGTYTFRWSCISGDTHDPFVTDYATITDRATASPDHNNFVYFPAGPEPAEGYVTPKYEGANIRVDGAENQKMRIHIGIPSTDKEIKEAGVIITPTEVARRNQLTLGLSSIAYYAEDHAILYGVDENGKWIQMTEDATKYFNDSTTPNDSDSYSAVDVLGGKLSGIYTVYTLPINLEAPVSTYKDEETSEKITTYSVVFGGANGEGLYDDFDDFFTYYTIRPYIEYTDGTVTYGEHEYKSIYMLACRTIQEMLNAYNVTAVGTTDDVTTMYNMDEMYMGTMTDADGKTIKDPDGNTIYVPVLNTSFSSSPYAGGAEYSIYWPEPRLKVFRWFAIRTLNRANKSSLRPEYYDDFHPDVKVLVEQYVEMYENIWKLIEECEDKRYVKMQ